MAIDFSHTHTFRTHWVQGVASSHLFALQHPMLNARVHCTPTQEAVTGNTMHSDDEPERSAHRWRGCWRPSLCSSSTHGGVDRRRWHQSLASTT